MTILYGKFKTEESKITESIYIYDGDHNVV